MRIVQVGLGGFGRNWAAEVIPTVPEADVVATADIDARSRAAAVEAGVTTPERCFDSVEAALAATEPEAVLVTANLVGHVPAARAALEAGCHVLIEKPFAPSVAEGTELVELARRAGRVVAVSQNYRFFPAVEVVRSLVADRTLGELHAVELDFRQWSPPRTDGTVKPHHALDEPLLVDMSIHHVDLIRTIVGPITRVDARTWDPDWSAFTGPSEGAVLFESGPVVTSYRGSWVSQGPPTRWSGEWRMEFADGSVEWTSRGNGPDGGWLPDEVWLRRDGRRTAMELPAMDRLDRAGSLTEFVTAIKQGRAPHTNGTDNLATIAATFAAVESARARGPVDVIAG